MENATVQELAGVGVAERRKWKEGSSGIESKSSELEKEDLKFLLMTG